MIQVILGGKGSGKTKRLFDIVADALKTEKGNISFVAPDDSNMYAVPHEVRYVNTSEYPAVRKCNAHEFLAFLSGMLSADYDLSVVAIDNFLKVVKAELFSEELQDFFSQLAAISDSHNCRFVISVSAENDEVPDFVKQYAI